MKDDAYLSRLTNDACEVVRAEIMEKAIAALEAHQWQPMADMPDEMKDAIGIVIITIFLLFLYKPKELGEHICIFMANFNISKCEVR